MPHLVYDKFNFQNFSRLTFSEEESYSKKEVYIIEKQKKDSGIFFSI